jgi:hypothetical protein
MGRGPGLPLANDERAVALLERVIDDLRFYQITHSSPEIAEAIRALKFISETLLKRFDQDTGARREQ